MSGALDAILAAEMARWEASGLRRRLERAPFEFPREREFTSNDYLSLANHPAIASAAKRAIERYGIGARAARLLGGGSPLDAQCESAVADWLGAEAALLFPTGYQANVGVVSALAGRGDAIVSDELVHASLIDAARLSRAEVHVHRHLDLEHAAELLAASRSAARRIVLTEGVFSMDGDLAPLAALALLCERHDAWLVIDEAHATGLIGPSGAGAWEDAVQREPRLQRLDTRLAARVVTGGKALGVSGAFVVGSRALREHLLNRARSFVFTTAVSPAVSGALTSAIEIARESERARQSVLARAQMLARAIGAPVPAAAIVPVIVGASEAALRVASELQSSGFDVRAVRPPTVPEGSSRLRIAVHAHNDDSSVQALAARLRELLPAQPSKLPRVPSRLAPALFVVGTDTDVGKTVVSALCVRAAAEHGAARYWKPVQTGSASDTQTVLRLAGQASPRVLAADPLHSLALAASPHEAARSAGRSITVDGLRERLTQLRSEEPDAQWIVELAGGLLVPYDAQHTQADWLAAERLPLVLVARSGLGTLNHTLLTLEALAARGLCPQALFLVGTPHASNRQTLRERSGIEHVFELAPIEPLDAAGLARWLEQHPLSALFDRSVRT
jgi:8-amino-7-oxononanoate synthase